jgi:hypothetical protein
MQHAAIVTAQISPASYDKAGNQYPLEWHQDLALMPSLITRWEEE